MLHQNYRISDNQTNKNNQTNKVTNKDQKQPNK